MELINQPQQAKLTEVFDNIRGIDYYSNIVGKSWETIPLMDGYDYYKLTDSVAKLNKDWKFIDKTSGTTSSPKIRYVTARDYAFEVRNAIRNLQTYGLNAGDTILFLDLWFPRLYSTFEAAANKLNIKCVYNKIENFDSEILKDNPDAILTVPSVLMRAFQGFSQDYNRLQTPKLSKVLYFGEQMSPAFRNILNNDFNLEIFSDFGATEVFSIAAECNQHNGEHILDDSFIVEKINDELVVTSIIYEGTPVVRYKLGDIIELDYDKCKCGNPSPRMKLKSRRANVITIFGSDFYLSSFEDAILSALDEPNPFRMKFEESNGRYRLEFLFQRPVVNKEKIMESVLNLNDLGRYFGKFVDIKISNGETKHFEGRKFRLLKALQHT